MIVVIVGGIAEMYLVSEEEEGIFLNKRLSTIKVAIEEVTNSCLFNII
jgi:hypothetical protein